MDTLIRTGLLLVKMRDEPEDAAQQQTQDQTRDIREFEFGVGSFEFTAGISRLKTENSQPSYILFTTSFIIAVIFGSALIATAITSSSVIGLSVSGKHSSVMIETPKTFIPI